MNVVVTREAGKNDSLRAWLPLESTVSEVPLTTTTYFDPGDVRAALEDSTANGHYCTLVVTSERSANYVELALQSCAPAAEVYCVGPVTAEALRTRGVLVRTAGEGPAEELAPFITRGPVLVLGATMTRPELGAALREQGLEVVDVACYETVGVSLTPDDAATLCNADVLLIGAPSAWTLAREHVRSETWVVVPGTSTAAVVRRDHDRVLEGWGPSLRTTLAELAHQRDDFGPR